MEHGHLNVEGIVKPAGEDPRPVPKVARQGPFDSAPSLRRVLAGSMVDGHVRRILARRILRLDCLGHYDADHRGKQWDIRSV